MNEEYILTVLFKLPSVKILDELRFSVFERHCAGYNLDGLAMANAGMKHPEALAGA